MAMTGRPWSEPSPHRHGHGDLPDEIHLEAIGEIFPAAGTEEVILLAVISVNQDMFSMTPFTLMLTRSNMNAERWATFWAAGLGVATTKALRWAGTMRGQRDVAGAGRQVDEKEVGFVPEHVGEELP